MEKVNKNGIPFVSEKDLEQSNIQGGRNMKLPLSLVHTPHTYGHNVVDADGTMVIDVPAQDYGDHDRSDSIARSIIRACNNHYKLLEALRRTQHWIAPNDPDAEMIRQAIKEAES